MADPQQNYRNVLARLEAKDKKGTSLKDAYDTLSFFPGTGEAIAAYELPEVLSQSGKMMQSKDFVEAAAGTALGTLGVASVLPGIGPVAKYAKKGIEGFIPYLGPKTATAGGPDIDTSITKMEGPPSGVSNVSDQIDLGSGSLFSSEGKKGRRLLVLSCSDTKCPDVGDMKAVDRYLGPVFQSLKAMGTPADVDVAILSAKHGLIRADTPIQKYNDKMSPKKAEIFKQDAGQMSRIKNTLEGYDNVIVQGGKDYKDVIRAAAGDIKITEIAGGRGIGDQRSAMKQAIAFGKIDTPVYHFTQNTDPGFTKFDKDKLSWFDLGPHVGSTPRAANDRFVDEVFGVNMRKKIRDTMQETGKSREEVLATLKLPRISGNVGYDPSTNIPIGRNTLGGSIPLKADLSKPLLNPKTKKPFTEYDLNEYQADQYSKYKGEYFDASDILGEDPRVDIQDVKKFMRQHAKDLAAEGYTHIPYENAVEGVGDLSYVMLVDRPKGSTKVLQSPSAAKDPAKFDDADFMMEDGGVISLKDKAVNMNRGPQGIEPYVQYMEPGGVVQSIKDYVSSFFEEEPIVPERNIFEEQRIVAENSPFPKEEVEPVQETAPVQTKKEALIDLADREAGLELINKVGFNPLAYKMMQAGLRDNRSLSDFLKIYPTVTDDMTEKQKDDALTKQLEGLGLARGKYFPLDNMVVVEPMTQASAYFQSPTDMIIMHEVLHKGAQTLKKDPNVNIRSLREKLDANDFENIGDETKPGRAEHRFIQAIVNKAYVDDMLTQTSVYANRGLAKAQKILDNPKSGYGEKVSAEFDLKNIPKYIDRDKKQALMSEIRRSTNQYMEKFDKQKFKEIINTLYPDKGLFDRDRQDVEENFTLNELRQVYDLLNIIMLDQPATKKFAEEMLKSAPSGQLMDKKAYSDLFPQQFADPNRPYEKTYTNITPDMDYFQVMSARDKFIRKFQKERKEREKKENKAEGGVIGLKDRAVKMHRNVV
jgi:hypothetical protein